MLEKWPLQSNLRLKLQTYFGSLKTRIQGYISQQPSLEERTLSDGVFLEDEKSMDYTTLEETQLIVDMPLEAEQSGEDLSLDKEHRDALDGLTFSRDDPLHDAINRLLDWAIFHFGSVEKGSSIYDILDAIGRPASVRERYNGAVKGLTSPRILQYILQADPSSSEDPDEASHRIIALVPHLPGNSFSSDRFEVAFKSKPIHDHVIRKLKDFRYEDILQLIRFCREEGNSGPSIARVVFEKVAHRVLAGSQVSRKHVLKTYLVEQDQTLPDSPSFSMLPTSQSMFSHSIHARQIASVNFNDESAYIGFPMADTYFVPNSLSNPLLDSFCVDYSQGLDLDQVQVDVWLFQITLSSRHGLVSAGGYSQFRHILQAATSYAETWHSQESGSIRTAKKQSPELTIVTITHCVLVCPDELKSRKWNMSPGWFQRTQKDTQFKSECFLIDLDVLKLLLSLLRFNDSNVHFRSSLVMRLENIE